MHQNVAFPGIKFGNFSHNPPPSTPSAYRRRCFWHLDSPFTNPRYATVHRYVLYPPWRHNSGDSNGHTL